MNNDLQKIILPMIRKVLPGVIAADIVGVQPMSGMAKIPLETGETYKNDAVAYSEPGDEIEYYWVKPEEQTSVFSLNDEIARNNSILEWCNDTYGPMEDWSVTDRRWFASNRKFYFRDEADRTMFVLRWA
jgi:hypothetical protein